MENNCFTMSYLFLPYNNLKVKVLAAQSCLTFCNPMDCIPPGAFVHGILQARILEWVAVPLSKGSSRPRYGTHVYCTVGRFFTVWATREVCQGCLLYAIHWMCPPKIYMLKANSQEYVITSWTRSPLEWD